MRFDLSKYIKKIQQDYCNLYLVKFQFSNSCFTDNLVQYPYILLIDYKLAERNIELIIHGLFWLMQSKKYRQYLKNGGIAYTKLHYFADYEQIEEQSFYFGLVQAYLFKNNIME